MLSPEEAHHSSLGREPQVFSDRESQSPEGATHAWDGWVAPSGLGNPIAACTLGSRPRLEWCAPSGLNTSIPPGPPGTRP